MKRAKILFIIITCIAITAIIVTLVLNKNSINKANQLVDRSNVPVAVTTKIVNSGKLEIQKTLPARLNPVERATASTQVAGTISYLRIDLGSRVRKGEVIGHIDTKLTELSLQSATLSHEKLKKDYQRIQDLYKGNASSEIELLSAKYNFENTAVQRKQIKQQIENAKIIAPISGTVITNDFKTGEFANSGSSIAEIVNISKLKATVYLDETEVYYAKINQKVEIELPSFPQKTISGHIIYISPNGDENHNYQVDVLIDNPDEWLKAGTNVAVKITLKQEENAILIPQQAIVSDRKENYVYIISHGVAHAKKVKTGISSDQNIEIIGGLSLGDEVVLSGQINLKEGSITKVINK